MCRIVIWFALTLSGLLLLLQADAADILTDKNLLMPEYNKDWQTLSSPHFNIHFEAAHKIYAQQVAAIAERVHVKLSPWLGWQPLEKTEVVLLDTVDTSNGMATPLPYNQITLYLQHPADGQLMDHLPWLEQVLTHEYVHILHLDMAYDGPQSVRNVFGRSMDLFTLLDFPQLFAPTWVTEGLAVYGESDNAARHGRLHSAYFDGLMRMEVQRGLRSLTEVSYNAGFRWPYGQQYLYGAYFFRFVEEQYGRDAVASYIRVYGSNLIPFRMDKRSAQIFNKSAEEVWAEFQAYLKKRFSAQSAGISQQPAPRTSTVFAEPYSEYALTAGQKGELYFVHDDQSSGAMVRRLNADGSVDYVLEGRGVQEMDWNDQSGLLLNKLEVCDNTNVYTDLYVWQQGMNGAKRITQCGRYLTAAWRPDGKAIAAVQVMQGIYRLVLLDTEGQLIRVLATLQPEETMGHADWSPDGDNILVAVQRKVGGWGIEQLQIESSKWQVLLRNGDLQQRPHYSADGKSVYFLSDHGKVWNLNAMELDKRQARIISNSQSQITDAQQMPDGSYRLLQYTAFGSEIVALDKANDNLQPQYTAVEDKQSAADAIIAEKDFQPYPDTGSKPYSPWHTLQPQAWFPVWDRASNEASYAGILLQGADALRFHRWQALPLYYYDLKTWGGLASYNFYNTFVLLAEKQYFMIDNTAATVRYRDEEVRYQALLQHSFNTLDTNWYLAAGVAKEMIEQQVYSGSAPDMAYRNTLAGGIVQYDSTHLYKRSISLADGRRVQLLSEGYDANSDYSGKTSHLDWQEYFALGSNHVLYLRGLRAAGDDGIRPYRLGGVSETLSQIGGPTGLGRRSFPLRGYPSGLATLQGSNLALATVEWRLPLGYKYDGWMAPPVGVGRSSVSLFADSGDAWNSGETPQYKTGVGAELKFEALLGYDLLRVNMTAGVARGLDSGGEKQLYLRMTLPML